MIRRGPFVSLREHFEALQALRDRYDAELRIADEKFRTERDRRYAEVGVEREKALKIKEVADLAALQLAREIQTYKDEKANELRSQIERERGSYATHSDLKGSTEKIEALVKPLSEWMSGQQGQARGVSDGTKLLLQIAAVLIAAVGLYLALRR